MNPFIFILGLLVSSCHSHSDHDDDWCGTKPYSLTRAKRGGESTCATPHVCNDPTTRAVFFPPTDRVVVRLQWVLFLNSSDLEARIEENMALLNSTFRVAKIAFVHSIKRASFNDPIDTENSIIENRIKSEFAVNWQNSINIFVPVVYLPKNIKGAATFPEDPQSKTILGGMWIRNETIGSVKLVGNIFTKQGFTLIHEMGHQFGLYHPFDDHSGNRGTCPQLACAEGAENSTNFKGDLCADTPPQPKSTLCADPLSTIKDCRGRSYGPTAFANFMGITDELCQNQFGSFSNNQIARMRCFISTELSQYVVHPNSSAPCTDNNGCDDQNPCTVGTCNSDGSCSFFPTICTPAKCKVASCRGGTCVETPKTCSVPSSLSSCATASCNPSSGECELNTTNCFSNLNITNDCCASSSSPFCNDEKIVECVCSSDSYCCSQTGKWDQDCVNEARLCGLDCLESSVSSPQNVVCSSPTIISYKTSSTYVLSKFINFDAPLTLSCFGSDIQSSAGLWFRLNLGQYSDDLEINTCWPDTHLYNTKILVFTGKCNNLNCLASIGSTDACGAASGKFTVSPRTDYYIFVGSPDSGTVGISFNFTTSAPEYNGLSPAAAAGIVFSVVFVVVLLVMLLGWCMTKEEAPEYH